MMEVINDTPYEIDVEVEFPDGSQYLFEMSNSVESSKHPDKKGLKIIVRG